MVTNLGSRVDGELQFALLSIVHTQSLKEKRSESRSSTSAEGMEDKESLKTGALISQFSDSVQAQVDNFFSDCVVASSVVVGCVFLQKLAVSRNFSNR